MPGREGWTEAILYTPGRRGKMNPSAALVGQQDEVCQEMLGEGSSEDLSVTTFRKQLLDSSQNLFIYTYIYINK